MINQVQTKVNCVEKAPESELNLIIDRLIVLKSTLNALDVRVLDLDERVLGYTPPSCSEAKSDSNGHRGSIAIINETIDDLANITSSISDAVKVLEGL